MAGVHELGIEHLRTGVSWADWYSADGERWYDWLIPRLASEFTLLPCVVYTPPSIAIAPKAAAPPRRPRDYADFLDFLIGRHGAHFEHLELWNEPNNIAEWDWRLDLEWNAFAEMIRDAAHWCRRRGKRTVLGGMSPLDRNWLWLMGAKGALDDIDVIGIHGFPGTWEVAWEGWEHVVDNVRVVLGEHGLDADIWITEAGYSTWRHDEFGQVRELVEALDAPVSRVYWYGAEDLQPERVTVGGFQTDIRHYHTGIRDTNGSPKLLARLLGDVGLNGVRDVASFGRIERTGRSVTLVTGGAGFIGANVAERLLADGRRVRILDNLARPGSERNLRRLVANHGGRIEVEVGDLRDPVAVMRAVKNVDAVLQFGVHVSARPQLDFDVNLAGVVRLLEALRALDEPPPLVFASTSKVYGALDDLRLMRRDRRWEPVDPLIAATGISEDSLLRPEGSYACSRAAADQYVLDYARTYSMPALVLRLSSAYGADGGWVTRFLHTALAREPITIFGDGAQVRDVLFVEDAVAGVIAALERAHELGGAAFNVGGGIDCAVSLLELVELIADVTGRRPDVEHAPARRGDRRYYVSDIARFSDATGWAPKTSPRAGLGAMTRTAAGASR